MKKKTEIVDLDTGEIKEEAGILGEAKHVEYRRPDGSLFVGQDFSNCPTMAEQHTAHLTDLNYLIEKYKPDELAAYMSARNQHRQEILGWDFARELSGQEARNVVANMRRMYNELPEHVRMQFKNHLEFVKFLDNPQNAERMIQMGLATQRQIQELTGQTGQAPATAKTDPQATSTADTGAKS